jgi:ABC-type glycerol-3-phosphate transport system substrate-binding protein
MNKLLSMVAALTLTLAASSAAAQDVVVKWLHQQGDPEQRAYYEELARTYSENTPGVTVEVQHIEGQSFKAKLPTLITFLILYLAMFWIAWPIAVGLTETYIPGARPDGD